MTVSVQQQHARPQCAMCSQPILLIQSGRDRCERCKPTEWRILTGLVPANPRGVNPDLIPQPSAQLPSVRKQVANGNG
jgi:hypothetical protein